VLATLRPALLHSPSWDASGLAALLEGANYIGHGALLHAICAALAGELSGLQAPAIRALLSLPDDLPPTAAARVLLALEAGEEAEELVSALPSDAEAPLARVSYDVMGALCVHLSAAEQRQLSLTCADWARGCVFDNAHRLTGEALFMRDVYLAQGSDAASARAACFTHARLLRSEGSAADYLFFLDAVAAQVAAGALLSPPQLSFVFWVSHDARNKQPTAERRLDPEAVCRRLLEAAEAAAERCALLHPAPSELPLALAAFAQAAVQLQACGPACAGCGARLAPEDPRADGDTWVAEHCATMADALLARPRAAALVEAEAEEGAGSEEAAALVRSMPLDLRAWLARRRGLSESTPPPLMLLLPPLRSAVVPLLLSAALQAESLSLRRLSAACVGLHGLPEAPFPVRPTMGLDLMAVSGDLERLLALRQEGHAGQQAFLGSLGSHAAVFNVILASNTLGLKPCLDAGCLHIALMIRGRTPAEIRETFGISHDQAVEEEEIPADNPFAFQ